MSGQRVQRFQCARARARVFLAPALLFVAAAAVAVPGQARAQIVSTDYYQKLSSSYGGLTAPVSPGSNFGHASVALGDIDGDSVSDLAVGAPGDDDGGGDRGAVWILLMNASGTVKSSNKISSSQGGFSGVLDNGDNFGSSLAALGDLDGDGVGDLAVGAIKDDDAGLNRGAVWILFLNSDATVKSYQKVTEGVGGFAGDLDENDYFGYALAALETDSASGAASGIVVGAPKDDDGGTNRGAVYLLYLNADGTVNLWHKIASGEGGFTGALANRDEFGSAIAAIPDIDGDGRGDLAIGAPLSDDGGDSRGAVWVVMLNALGAAQAWQKISDTAGSFTGLLDNGDLFGASVASAGDINGDGRPDLVVGASQDDDDGTNVGAVWYVYLEQDGSVGGDDKISSEMGYFNGTIASNDRFGASVAAVGDLDGNGLGEIAVGAPNDDDGGGDSGAVWLLFVEACGNATLGSNEVCDDGNRSGNDYCADDCQAVTGYCGDGAVQSAVEACDAGAANSDTLADACRADCSAASCGDGVADTGEACDDANSSETDACLSDCTAAVCGDGVLWAGVEQCDQGAANSDTVSDACRADCSAASCGDGVADTGEACDDGNSSETDACLSDCTAAVCGDGVLWAGVEQCDQGAANSDTVSDACRADCSAASCGDGVADTGEACDDANSSDDDACLSDCTTASCGDGVLWVGVEQCDQGAANSDTLTDACRSDCNAASCGDGVADTGEVCDDGNGSETDGCLTTCAAAVCGDGHVLAGVETCDDGNSSNADGCLNDCTAAACGDAYLRAGVEQCDQGAANSDTAADACRTDCSLASCGDAVADTGEACDDGNGSDTDACLTTCAAAVCGDGHVRAGVEVCDDGNSSNADGCLNDCTAAACGDAAVWAGVEQCDQGSANSDTAADACRTDCTAPSCGDSVTDNGEVCDDGNSSNFDLCLSDCTAAVCGDGYVQAGAEECDDANADDSDACLSDCRSASCGDGYLQTGVEECDSAITPDNNDLLCDSNCSFATCGNGLINAGEECDDGNEINSDSCLNDCSAAVCGDGVLCTDAACTAGGGAPETCDDGNSADGDCCSSACQLAAEGDTCDDEGVPCTRDSCDGQGSCRHELDDDICNDGWWCNGTETCDNVSGCQAGTAPDCDDGLSCTVDACNERADACVNMPAHYLCSDGSYCNGAEICDTASGCVDGSAIDCSSLDNGCREPFCDEDSDSCQATAVNEAASCDHIDLCAAAAVCAEGLCTGVSAAQSDTKVRVRFAKGENNDSLAVKTAVAPADMPGVSCASAFTMALAAGDGTAIYSGTLPSGSLVRRGDDSHCRHKSSSGDAIAGMRMLTFKYNRRKEHYRVKAKMKGVEMPAGRDKTDLMLSLVFGEAATGPCVTAKDMTCKANERSIKCKMPRPAS